MTGRDAPVFIPEPGLAQAAAHADDFDGIVALAATLCDAPAAFLAVRSKAGFSLQAVAGPLPIGLAAARIAQALSGDDDEVRDLHEPEDLGGQDGMRYFAGVSIFDQRARRLGLLCLAYRTWRRLTQAQSRSLQNLAQQAGTLLEPHLPAEADEMAERERALAAWRQAEADQRRRARLFAATADLAQEAMVLIDPESGRFVEFNSAAHRSLGYDRAEFSSLRLGDIDVNVPAESIRETYARLPSGDLRTLSARHRLRDGRLRDVTVTRRIIEVDGHRYVCAVWSADAGVPDTRVASLEETLKDLDVLNSTIAHDLRSPLHRIVGFAGLLSGEDKIAEDPVLQSYLACITSAAQKMERLITRLAEYMRLGPLVPVCAETGLDRIFAECIAESPAPTGGGAKWTVHPLPPVWADPGLMRVVVETLVDNAVKFSARRAAPEISVSPHETPGGAGFSIRDNGAGFDMAYAHKLMQVGSRLHAEVDFPGTGIGLAIARRVLEKHGGSIRFEAEVDRGAVFTVWLPAGAKPPGLHDVHAA